MISVHALTIMEHHLILQVTQCYYSPPPSSGAAASSKMIAEIGVNQYVDVDIYFKKQTRRRSSSRTSACSSVKHTQNKYSNLVQDEFDQRCNLRAGCSTRGRSAWNSTVENGFKTKIISNCNCIEQQNLVRTQEWNPVAMGR